MPGLTLPQAGAPETSAQSTDPEENMSSNSRSAESQDRQDDTHSSDNSLCPSEPQPPCEPREPQESNLEESQQPPAQNSQNGADIEVRLNDDPALGFCVFALRQYNPGDVLYTERTALEATHDVYKEGPRLAYNVYRGYSDTRKQKLHGSFPYLAWANNVDPHEAAECRHLITSNITSRNVRVNINLSAADHIRMRPDSALILEEVAAEHRANAASADADATSQSSRGTSIKASEVPAAGAVTPTTPGSPVAKVVSLFSSMFAPIAKLAMYDLAPEPVDPESAQDAALAATNSLPPPTTTKKARAAVITWFSRYAFRLLPEHAFPNTGKNHQAAVYLLTDLINHRCKRTNNCKVRTALGKVSLVAEKKIQPGEEITIDYLKEYKDFVCRAECCVVPPTP